MSDSPAALRVSPDRRILKVDWGDGKIDALSAEYLRVFSRSAEVRGHGDAERKIVGGKRHVTIAGIEPVGGYAVRIIFDDGHDSGLYAWDYLRELAARHDANWAEYLENLAARGLGRD